jgi:hypothetical protein
MDNCIDHRDDRADWVDLLVDTTLRRYRCSESASQRSADENKSPLTANAITNLTRLNRR